MDKISCININGCSRAETADCNVCANNRLRNYNNDYFVPAYDNPIPKINPKLEKCSPYDKATVGYICPVCNKFNNYYNIQNSLCGHCGFKLNI